MHILEKLFENSVITVACFFQALTLLKLLLENIFTKVIIKVSHKINLIEIDNNLLIIISL